MGTLHASVFLRSKHLFSSTWFQLDDTKQPEDKLSDLQLSLIVTNLGSSSPDDDDRDGHRNVGTIGTPNAADSPRRQHQVQ